MAIFEITNNKYLFNRAKEENDWMKIQLLWTSE